MPTIIQSVILGLVQGATELFPVSSLGHAVILPSLFGWQLDQANNDFLIFLVATHLATSLVLLGFFFKDWLRIIGGFIRSLKERRVREEDTYAKLGWLIVIGTIPAGILGLLFESKLKHLFALPVFAAIFLIANGFLLWGMENYKRKMAARQAARLVFGEEEVVMNDEVGGKVADVRIAHISWRDALKVGVAQCLALIPGFSRTGATMAGGLFVGLDHAQAARFSFLLATPIILAASVLKLPELWRANETTTLTPLIVGMLTAAVAAYLSVRFLTKYFETNNLKRFAVYCVAVGGFILIWQIV